MRLIRLRGRDDFAGTSRDRTTAADGGTRSRKLEHKPITIRRLGGVRHAVASAAGLRGCERDDHSPNNRRILVGPLMPAIDATPIGTDDFRVWACRLQGECPLGVIAFRTARLGGHVFIECKRLAESGGGSSSRLGGAAQSSAYTRSAGPAVLSGDTPVVQECAERRCCPVVQRGRCKSHGFRACGCQRLEIFGVKERGKWWPGTELNCRHYDFQSYALPTELPGRSVAENRAREFTTISNIIHGRDS